MNNYNAIRKENIRLQAENRRLRANRDGFVRVLLRMLLKRGVFVDTLFNHYERTDVPGRVEHLQTGYLYELHRSQKGSKAYEVCAALWPELVKKKRL